MQSRRIFVDLDSQIFNGVSRNGKAEVVFMNADRGVLQRSVFFNILFQEILKCVIAQLTFVGEVDLLVFLGDILILFLENGQKGTDKLNPFLMDGRSQGIHLLVVNTQGVAVKGAVGGKIFKQGIPLCDYFIVLDEVLQIYFVRLRNDPVHKLPSGLAPFQNKVTVGW